MLIDNFNKEEDDNLLSEAEAEEIKEFHFHVYFLQVLFITRCIKNKKYKLIIMQIKINK